MSLLKIVKYYWMHVELGHNTVVNEFCFKFCSEELTSKFRNINILQQSRLWLRFLYTKKYDLRSDNLALLRYLNYKVF